MTFEERRQEAKKFAIEAHGTQKYGDKPYKREKAKTKATNVLSFFSCVSDWKDSRVEAALLFALFNSERFVFKAFWVFVW